MSSQSSDPNFLLILITQNYAFTAEYDIPPSGHVHNFSERTGGSGLRPSMSSTLPPPPSASRACPNFWPTPAVSSKSPRWALWRPFLLKLSLTASRSESCWKKLSISSSPLPAVSGK
jgi:hypothetical protein